MAAPAQTAVRLVAALEDLAAGEGVALRAGDYAGALALQERAGPLVARLAGLAAGVDAAVRARVLALVERRRGHAARLQEAMDHARGELARMAEGRRTVARIAPVYGRPAAGAGPRFSARG